MPILREEPPLFPEDLFQRCVHESAERCWWVLYTKARQEKALARDLVSLEIPFYLPQVKRTSVSRGRRFTSWVPLFGGYVFLFASETERVRTLATNRISRVLEVRDPERLVFDLTQLRALIAADAPLTVESRLEPGRRVRVRQGALMGIEGTVLSRRGDVRLLVAVDFLQQGASVEIEDSLLEPLD
ncbi:MAG: transcription termination/antitermination protein NusG [Planctomycetota bacterium]